MLEIRPNCEYCDKDLPPDAPDAMICTYECTFCAACVDSKLRNVCPNCGGGFTPRPIRPNTARREGVSVHHQRPSTDRVHLRHARDEVERFVAKHRHVPPAER